MPLLEELVCYGIKLTIKKEDKTKNYQLRWDTKVQSIAWKVILGIFLLILVIAPDAI